MINNWRQQWSIPCGYYKYIKLVSIKSYLQTQQQWQTKQVSTNSVISTMLS